MSRLPEGHIVNAERVRSAHSNANDAAFDELRLAIENTQPIRMSDGNWVERGRAREYADSISSGYDETERNVAKEAMIAATAVTALGIAITLARRRLRDSE